MGLQSPAKRFVSIRARCLEATAILLGGLNKVRAARLTITNFECLTQGVLKPGQYIRHHEFFLWCVEEAFGMLNIRDRTEVNYFTTIIQSVVQYTEDIVNSPHYHNSEYTSTLRAGTGQLFLVIENIISVIERSEDGFVLVLTILTELKRLPVHVLTTMNSWPSHITRKAPPGTVMLQLMLKKDFIQMAYLAKGSNIKERYLAVFEKFVTIAAASKEDGLAALSTVLDSIRDEALSLLISPSKNIEKINESPTTNLNVADIKNGIGGLWKTIATLFKNHIDKYSEVNQSKTASLEHDLTACKNVLLHPFQMFSDIMTKNIWSKWADLYSQISMLAALVVTYKSLELEHYLSEEVMRTMASDNFTMTSQAFANFCQHLSQQMVSAIPYHSFQGHKGASEVNASIQEIGPIVGLLVELSRRSTSSDLKDKRAALAASSSLCLQLTNLLANISNPKMIRPLLKQVVPALVAFLSLYSAHGHGFEKQVKDLNEQALNQIQARYDGAFTLEFLVELKPFLLHSLSHTNRDIRSRAHQMWQLTFANSGDKESFPKDIKDVVKSYSWGLSSDSSISSSSQGKEISNGHESNMVISPVLNFGMLFDKSKRGGMILAKSPKNNSNETSNEPPKTPSSASKFAKPCTIPKVSSEKNKPKIILEDENSQDFVKISSPVLKKRPLTDHQKDKLTSRRDDIPALYSELSRDDSQLVCLPEQFQSQQLGSIDECESAMNLPDINDEFSKDIHNKNMNVKNETEADEHTDDLNCSVEVSMSIIAPNSIGKKTISTKSDDTEGKHYL